MIVPFGFYSRYIDFYRARRPCRLSHGKAWPASEYPRATPRNHIACSLDEAQQNPGKLTKNPTVRHALATLIQHMGINLETAVDYFLSNYAPREY